MDIDRETICNVYYNRYFIDPFGFKKVTKPLGFPHKIDVNAFSFANCPRYVSGVINPHITSDALDFEVNTVVIQYCVYFEI